MPPRDEPHGEQQRTPKPLIKFVTHGYQQIAAIIGAFALIAFLSHFADFQWRGFMATLMAHWTEYVRPAMSWLMNLLVTVPLGWFGWRVNVPLMARDYLAVGLITLMSMYRTAQYSRADPDPDGDTLWEGLGLGRPWLTLFTTCVIWIAWPGMVVVVLIMLMIPDRRTIVNSVLMLAPLVYVGGLFALNRWVL